MKRTTQGVEDLVKEILETFPKPHSEDITDEVCVAIEKNKKWRSRYDLLSSELRDWVVNNWIGQYVARTLGRKRGTQAVAKSTLITSYSKLPL